MAGAFCLYGVWIIIATTYLATVCTFKCAGAGIVDARVFELHLPNKVYITINIIIVDRHPPPNFFAPHPAISALKKLFISIY